MLIMITLPLFCLVVLSSLGAAKPSDLDDLDLALDARLSELQFLLVMGDINKEEFDKLVYLTEANYYLMLPDNERADYWNSCTTEEQINLARHIGHLEGSFGPDVWQMRDNPGNDDYKLELEEILIEFGKALDEAMSKADHDYSDMGPLIEWAKDSYQQSENALANILDQVVRGPNPDLPGMWSARKPYGDIYSPYDRIVDDSGKEYIKNHDGSWSLTGNNYGPYQPGFNWQGQAQITTAPAGGSLAAAPPPSSPSPPDQQPQPQPQQQGPPPPQPDPKPTGRICTNCGLEFREGDPSTGPTCFYCTERPCSGCGYTRSEKERLWAAGQLDERNFCLCDLSIR